MVEEKVFRGADLLRLIPCEPRTSDGTCRREQGENLLRWLRGDFPDSFSASELDAWTLRQHSRLQDRNVQRLAQALALIPIATVAQTFGDDAAMFAFLNSAPLCDDRGELFQHFELAYKEKFEALCRAWIVTYQYQHRCLIGDVMRCLQLEDILPLENQSVASEADGLTGRHAMLSCSSRVLKFPDAVTAWLPYGIAIGFDHSWPKRQARGPHGVKAGIFVDYSVHLDAAYALYLAAGDKPLAVVTFDPGLENGLIVRQIQGVRGKLVDADGQDILDADGNEQKIATRELFGLDWKSILLRRVAELSAQLGATHLGIQSAQNNRWTKPGDRHEPPRLELAHAKALYDDLALALGFQQNGNRNWQLELNHLPSSIRPVKL